MRSLISILGGVAMLFVLLGRTDYTSAQLFDIIRRYNGFGPAAERYARAVTGFYEVFEGHNAALR